MMTAGGGGRRRSSAGAGAAGAAGAGAAPPRRTKPKSHTHLFPRRCPAHPAAATGGDERMERGEKNIFLKKRVNYI